MEKITDRRKEFICQYIEMRKNTFGKILKTILNMKNIQKCASYSKNIYVMKNFTIIFKTYIDISLNAPKLPDKDNLTVTASFQYSDIDKAKEATTNFINICNIQNIEELLEVIKMFYPYASNDNRQKSGTLFKDVRKRFIIGRIVRLQLL